MGTYHPMVCPQHLHSPDRQRLAVSADHVATNCGPTSRSTPPPRRLRRLRKQLAASLSMATGVARAMVVASRLTPLTKYAKSTTTATATRDTPTVAAMHNSFVPSPAPFMTPRTLRPRVSAH